MMAENSAAPMPMRFLGLGAASSSSDADTLPVPHRPRVLPDTLAPEPADIPEDPHEARCQKCHRLVLLADTPSVHQRPQVLPDALAPEPVQEARFRTLRPCLHKIRTWTFQKATLDACQQLDIVDMHIMWLTACRRTCSDGRQDGRPWGGAPEPVRATRMAARLASPADTYVLPPRLPGLEAATLAATAATVSLPLAHRLPVRELHTGSKVRPE